jgi:integrase
MACPTGADAQPVLRWQDVNWIGRPINVEHGIANQQFDSVKTEEPRKAMTLDSRLLKALSRWRQESELRDAEDWPFPSPAKLGRLSYSCTGYWRALQTTATAAGLGKLGTHTFRHAYRSWLDAVGRQSPCSNVLCGTVTSRLP